MSKNFREQIRVDLLTSQLIYSLIDKMSTDENKMTKSDLYRSAIYRMAKEELSPEEFAAVVQSSMDLENI